MGGSGTVTVAYLHADMLWSVGGVSDAAGQRQGLRYYTFGAIRLSSTMPATALAFTGQRQDGTGLLHYNARYYDPTIGRFASADSVVPGAASGMGGAVASLGPGFSGVLAAENRFTLDKGCNFQLSDADRRQAKDESGPMNAQALNRYSYVLNNPVRYADPSGYEPETIAVVIINSVESAFEVLHALGSFLNANGAQLTLTGTLGNGIIGIEGQASAAWWNLGPDMHNFITERMDYLEGYINGSIGGVITITFAMWGPTQVRHSSSAGVRTSPRATLGAMTPDSVSRGGGRPGRTMILGVVGKAVAGHSLTRGRRVLVLHFAISSRVAARGRTSPRRCGGDPPLRGEGERVRTNTTSDCETQHLAIVYFASSCRAVISTHPMNTVTHGSGDCED